MASSNLPGVTNGRVMEEKKQMTEEKLPPLTLTEAHALLRRLDESRSSNGSGCLVFQAGDAGFESPTGHQQERREQNTGE